MAENKTVEEAKKRFEKARTFENDNRLESIEDVRFVDLSDQWDERDLSDRKANGRPSLVINKLVAVVDQIVNQGRQNTPVIKVRPYDKSSDPNVAQVLTGLIKNIENESDADSAYDYSFECAVKGGFGYIRVLTEYANDEVFEQDIRIKRVENPYSIYIDPQAKKPDRSDIKWAFVVDKMPRDDFKTTYPGKEATSLDVEGVGYDVSGDDEDYVYIAEYFYVKPEKRTLHLFPSGETVWDDEVPEEVKANPEFEEAVKSREVEYNKVYWCTISGADILEPVQEWQGKYIPIVPVFGRETWIEGKLVLQSAIRHAKDPQRLYNWARSTTAETVALAPKQPFIATVEQIEGHEEQWNDLNRKCQPYLLYNSDPAAGGAPQRQQASIPDTGAIQEAMNAADDIKATTGKYDASLGATSNETSGRAIIARQQQGDTATYNYHDNLARAIKHVGRIIVDLIPKIYDTERQIRILGNDHKEKIITVNQQGPMGETINDITRGKYDVVVDTGPSYKTMRMETADAITQILQVAPQAASVLIPRLAKVLDIPDGEEIANEIQQVFQPPQQQGPTPEQQIEMLKLKNEQMKMQATQQKGQQDLAKGQQALEKGQLDIQGKEIDLAGKMVDLQGEITEQDMRTYQVSRQAIADYVQGR